MLDDLMEIALDIGGEMLGAVIEHVWDSKKQTNEVKRGKKEDPWSGKDDSPPWEV